MHKFPERLLTVSEVAAIFGWSRSTVFRKVKAGVLPPPRKLGPNTTRWVGSEIHEVTTRIVATAPLAGSTADDRCPYNRILFVSEQRA